MFYFLLLSNRIVMMADTIKTSGRKTKKRKKEAFSMMLFTFDFLQYALDVVVFYVVSFLSHTFKT
jgi:hypothetical protein